MCNKNILRQLKPEEMAAMQISVLSKDPPSLESVFEVYLNIIKFIDPENIPIVNKALVNVLDELTVQK